VGEERAAESSGEKRAGYFGWDNLVVGSWRLEKRGREGGRQRMCSTPKMRTRSYDKVIDFSWSA